MGAFPTLGKRPIQCRVLVLYRVDPLVVARFLPAGNRPLLVQGCAVGEACYTRLGPSRFLRGRISPTTDHLTYRFGVERQRADDSAPQPLTWVARRETSSWLEARCGEKLLRCEYGRSQFRLREDQFGLELAAKSVRGEEFYLSAEAPGALRDSLFPGAHALEEFFARRAEVEPQDVFAPEADELDLESCFAPEPLAVFTARSAFFDERASFPAGSAVLDSAWRVVSRRAELAPRRSSARLKEILAPAPSSPALPPI
jgi:hypothetical protein